jgi:oxygen-dependent protoporphyrinogen oxidase
MDLFVPPKRDNADESVGSFVRRRLGTEALEKIAEPLMSGIHVSDPEQQSLLGTFPRFRTLEKEHGSLIRGMLAQRRTSRTHPTGTGSNGSSGPTSIFMSLRGGMIQLIDTLEQKLTGGQVITGCQVTGLQQASGGSFVAQTACGGTLDADAVICATPAFVTSDLLTRLDPRLSAALNAIRYISTATLSLAYRKSDIGGDLNGFGFVVPRKERRDLTACTWTSTKFNHRAPEGMVLLRSFVGGPGQEEIVDRSDDEILEVVKSELAQIMGLHAQPVLTRLYRWRQANPQYDVGHLDRAAEMHALSAQTPGLFLTGSAFEGVGLPDCVRQGQQSAEKVIEYLCQ